MTDEENKRLSAFPYIVRQALVDVEQNREYLEYITDGYRSKEDAHWRQQGYTREVHETLLMVHANLESARNLLKFVSEKMPEKSPIWRKDLKP